MRIKGVLFLAALAFAAALAGAAQQKPSSREDAYRANNIGVARLEQADFGAATASFRRALSSDPSLAIARLNLGIALFNEGNREEARVELEAARKALPDTPHPAYMLGLIARAENRPEDAIEAFTRVLKIDPLDAGANVNLGQVYPSSSDTRTRWSCSARRRRRSRTTRRPRMALRRRSSAAARRKAARPWSTSRSFGRTVTRRRSRTSISSRGATRKALRPRAPRRRS
jgi:tetratricopeptide (TPR) repeat protein